MSDFKYGSDGWLVHVILLILRTWTILQQRRV